MTGRRSGVEGWSLVGIAAIVVTALVAGTLAVGGTEEAGIRAAIRMTAGTSLVFFLAAFVASAMNTLSPSPATKWLLRNRRYIGVSFAVSMLGHLVLISALVLGYSGSFWSRVALTTLVGGGFGYVMILAMTATSFDRTAKAIGRKAWSALHTTGMYVFWFIFFASYAGRAATSLRYAISFGLLLVAMTVRIAAARKRATRGRRAGRGDERAAAA
jgi:hypothetical protein